MQRARDSKNKDAINEPLDGRLESPAVLQLKQKVGDLPYGEQVEALKPPKPLQLKEFGHPVQFDPDTSPGTESEAAAEEYDPAKDTKFGQPYESKVEATAAEAWLTSMFIPAVTAAFGMEVGKIWIAYLGRKPGDSLAPRKYTEEDEIGAAFVRNPITHYVSQLALDAAQQVLLHPDFAELLNNLKSDEWVSYDLTTFVADPNALQIDYSSATDIPGHLAGGISGSDAGEDSRSITGSIGVFCKINDEGFITELNYKPLFAFHIADCVDFNPGGPGAGIEQIFTVPLSRLEASGLAYDVPFAVTFKAPDTRIGAPLPDQSEREKHLTSIVEIAATAKAEGYEAAGKLALEKATALKDEQLAKAAAKAEEIKSLGFSGVAAKIAEKATGVAGDAADKAGELASGAVDAAADKVSDWLLGELFDFDLDD